MLTLKRFLSRLKSSVLSTFNRLKQDPTGLCFIFFLIFLIAMIFGLLWQINDCFQTISHLTLTVQEQKMAIEALSVVKDQQASELLQLSSELMIRKNELTLVRYAGYLTRGLEIAGWFIRRY